VAHNDWQIIIELDIFCSHFLLRKHAPAPPPGYTVPPPITPNLYAPAKINTLQEMESLHLLQRQLHFFFCSVKNTYAVPTSDVYKTKWLTLTYIQPNHKNDVHNTDNASFWNIPVLHTKTSIQAK